MGWGEVDDFGLDVCKAEAVHQVLHFFEARGGRIARENLERAIHFGHESGLAAGGGASVPDFQTGLQIKKFHDFEC